MTVKEVLKALGKEVTAKYGYRVRFYTEPDGDDQLKLWREADETHILIGYLLLWGKKVDGFAAASTVRYADVPTFLHALDADK